MWHPRPLYRKTQFLAEKNERDEEEYHARGSQQPAPAGRWSSQMYLYAQHHPLQNSSGWGGSVKVDKLTPSFICEWKIPKQSKYFLKEESWRTYLIMRHYKPSETRLLGTGEKVRLLNQWNRTESPEIAKYERTPDYWQRHNEKGRFATHGVRATGWLCSGEK